MIRMAKQGNMTGRKAAAIRVTAILLAFLASSLFIRILGHNPLAVYGSMLVGAFGSPMRIRDTLTVAIPLTLTSIGILVAFKMKFWNIGAEGQILMGAFAASMVAYNLGNLSRWVVLPLMFLAGFVGGGLWALLPAWLKMKWNTNETIITLMLNYIAIKWITFLQYGPWRDPASMGFPKMPNFASGAIVPKLFGIQAGFLVAILFVVLAHYFMHHSKGGYEVAVVGESVDTARYAGMNVKKIVLTALVISGGISGIVGMLEASGVNHTLNASISAGYGFTAIITTWLSGLKPLVVLPVSILFAAMTKGGGYIQTVYQIPQAAAQVLQSMILFFVIGSEFFVQYKLVFQRKKSPNPQEGGQ
ncbi:ABC transporter permease [Anaerotalea alkaliphila]|uniref:ABC transporter permease n=1 Tax=Anaerotalea alkaliphila TaxID=2662126 RepID=A0A7X5HVE1_9FIRM|nr:ABC transporter permease [Anaerotalea alkaliphila]NDL67340.1 ABC transporter permease [Anaerotalea alkaliphila]